MVRWSRTVLGLGAAVAMLVPLLPWGPSTAVEARTLDDLDDAEQRVEDVEAELDDATTAYETVWADLERTRVELADLERQASRLAADASAAEAELADRARATFKRGSLPGLATLFASGEPSAAADRVSLLAALQLRDRARVEGAEATRRSLAQVEQLVEDRAADLDRLQRELDAQAERLQDELADAQAEAATIRSLVSRQRRIDRGPQQGIYACIFDQGAYRFRDTWGAPRSGGRRHQGTDVFARFDAPVYAITSGVIARHSNSRLGGIGLYLRGDDGNLYYYAHLNAIEANGAVGNRVVAGEPVARNGSTGNADRSAPHVHFELLPGGGAKVNPYPWLAAACF